MRFILAVIFSGLAYAQAPIEVPLGPPASTVTPPNGCVVTSQTGSTTVLTCTSAQPPKCVITVSPSVVTQRCATADNQEMSAFSQVPRHVGDGVVQIQASLSGYGVGLLMKRKAGSTSIVEVQVARSVPGPTGQPPVTTMVWQGEVTAQ